jgi:predicted DsbA family dithiol-disulfide isomerase
MPKIEIAYYSDVLCIWAYVAERRLEELIAAFGDEVEIRTRYCSVFPDAWSKIETKGGFEAFNAHVRDVATRFPHVSVNDDVWLTARPRTSASAHLFLKAVELIETAKLEGGKPLPYLDSTTTRWTGAFAPPKRSPSSRSITTSVKRTASRVARPSS